jgi:hypothetical protein
MSKRMHCDGCGKTASLDNGPLTGWLYLTRFSGNSDSDERFDGHWDACSTPCMQRVLELATGAIEYDP